MKRVFLGVIAGLVSVLCLSTLTPAAAAPPDHAKAFGFNKPSTENSGSNGANTAGPYDPYGVGQPSGNGNGDGNANGKPCAGCVGNADSKNPPGQLPGPDDGNNGYECDGNSGVARGNPAHSFCQPTTTTTLPPTTTTTLPPTTTTTVATTVLGPATTTTAPSVVLGAVVSRKSLPLTGSNTRVARIAVAIILAGVCLSSLSKLGSQPARRK